jgi:hypothetical protein
MEAAEPWKNLFTERKAWYLRANLDELPGGKSTRVTLNCTSMITLLTVIEMFQM